MSKKHMSLSPEQVKILKTAKKRKKVTCNQFNWWVLADMVKQEALDKVLPNDGNNVGWPYFKLSRKGRKHLDKLYKQEQRHRNTSN